MEQFPNKPVADEILQSMGEVLLIFWNREEGIQAVVNRSRILFDEQKFLEKGYTIYQENVHEEDQETFRVFVRRILQAMEENDNRCEIKDDRISVAVRMKKKDGGESYHTTECYLHKDEKGTVAGIVAVVYEMTAEEIYRLQLSQSVTNDLNPRMFLEVASGIMRQNPTEKYVLIQFDVAKFKGINALYGEPFGDELLNFFIESLKVICSKDQLFVRLTADVFMIMMSYESEQDILDFIEMVNKNLTGYKDVLYRLVFGVCYVEDMNVRLRRYGDRAALARQSIKENALEHVAFYREQMNEAVLSKKYLEDHMEKALEEREFVLFLQPKYHIDSGRIVGAEALVRWDRPGRGLISPAEFVPVFEQNGFVTKMDAYIWEEACKVIRNWMDMGKEPLPISVNLSRVHLKKQKYLETLNYLVDKYRIPKPCLEIEITESADEEEVFDGISALKRDGYTLLMDDFGSGYSSLNTLKDTQFDTIKIDRAFLQDFIESARGQKIVEHIIQMTRSIGLDIVAEGVETEEQAKYLAKCGCHVAQGFYYAKPMTVKEFNQLLG